MEPDDTADKAAGLELSSKIAYFNSQNKAQESMPTDTMSLSKGPPSSPRPSTRPPPSKETTASQQSPIDTTKEERERSDFESNVEIQAEPPSERSDFKSKGECKVEPQSESHRFNDELRSKAEEVAFRKSSGWSPNDMEIFQRPMCLIGADQSNTLTISADVVSQLEKIEWPMVVISVVGLYRTGKSYLMNRLAQSTSGFALGDTIESTTKGIWAWCKMHPEKTNTVLLLLDTEGLGDVDKGDQNHDNKIFTLATLLCNCLVYNMKGAFDQDAVNKLTFVTEMASNIRYRGKASEDNHILNLILPDFVLCVRDFSLKLSKGGKKITEDEYLESSLEEKKDKADHFNKPRQCIRKYFPKRKCFTFPVPGDGDVLENLETLRFDQLSNKFKETTVRFTTYIYGKEPKELVNSKPVNGLMFVTLANHYVTAIRNGAVPDVDDAFLAVAKIENAKIQKKALEIFESQMVEIVFPVSASQLEKSYTNAQQNALDYLRKNVVHDKDGAFEHNTQMNMDNIWNKLKDENFEKIKEMCETKLQEIYSKSLKEKIETKAFEVAGGYRKFQRDMELTKQEYFSSLRAFKEHEVSSAWFGFINIIKQAESVIIESDDAMSQKEKEDEKKRSDEKIKQVMEQQENAHKEALAQQERKMDAHLQKLNEDRQKQMEEDKRKYTELVNEKLAKEAAEKELSKFKTEQEERKKENDALNQKLNDERFKHMEDQMKAQNALYEEKLARQKAEAKGRGGCICM